MADIEYKSFQMELNDTSETGEFTGYASVYGNKDLVGDVVEKGAFARTLDHKGSQIPILWQHKQDNPIGVGRLSEDGRGLLISGQLNLQVRQAKEAYALLKQGALKGLSIGYDVQKEQWVKDTRHLKEVRLWEVSLVTFPANPETTVTNVKNAWPFDVALLSVLSGADELKAGRVLSARSKRLIIQAVEALNALLGDAEPVADPSASLQEPYFPMQGAKADAHSAAEALLSELSLELDAIVTDLERKQTDDSELVDFMSFIRDIKNTR